MTATTDPRVLDLLDRWLQLEEEARESWLQQQRQADPHLAAALQALIRASDQAGDFLEPPAAADVKPPARLGAYELIEPLQEGGMGTVYLARRADDSYRQRVAVKLIRAEHLMRSDVLRADLVRRFESERQILARLSHPNIARILDGGQTEDGHPYLVMEFVDGISLTDYVRREGLDVGEILTLFIRICEAVQQAHQNLIVHRDIKPENILVTDAGEPKLLDFGIAKVMDAAAQPGNQTLTGLGAMTPAYASPEQVRAEPVTTASDVYSLGVLLYELLAGQRPYDLTGVTPAQAERTVCETQPQPPSAAATRNAEGATWKRRSRMLRGDLDNIVLKAMRKEPGRRYRSAAELSDDLRNYLAGRPVSAHRDSLGYRSAKFLRRNRVAAGLSAIFLVGLVATTAVALKQARVASDAADSAQQMNRFLLDTLATTDPFTSGGEPTLAEVLRAAEEMIDERFAGRPLLEAEVRHTLGYAALSRHDLETADRLLRQGLALRQAHLPTGHPDLTQSLDGVAWLLFEQGRLEESEALFLRAIDDIETADNTDHPVYATILNDLAVLYLNGLEDAVKAQPFIERSWQASTRPGSQTEVEELVSMKENMAYTAELLGDIDRAKMLYDEAHELALEVLPPGHPNLAINLNNRGLLEFDHGDQALGLALIEESFQMRKASFGGDHPDVWIALHNLSSMNSVAGNDEKALAFAQESAAMARRLHPEPHLHLGVALLNLAECYLETGQLDPVPGLVDEAESVFDNAEGNFDRWREGIGKVRERLSIPVTATESD